MIFDIATQLTFSIEDDFGITSHPSSVFSESWALSRCAKFKHPSIKLFLNTRMHLIYKKHVWSGYTHTQSADVFCRKSFIKHTDTISVNTGHMFPSNKQEPMYSMFKRIGLWFCCSQEHLFWTLFDESALDNPRQI